MSSFDCDACDQDHTGERVVVTTEASAEDGVDVALTKRWVLCRSCGDAIFGRIGEASPWVDDDFKTLAEPGGDGAAFAVPAS